MRFKRFIFASMIGTGVLTAFPAFADGDAEKGRTVFNKCTACHSTVAGQNKLGPSLAGVVGRKAGSAAGFTAYSPALKDSGITWTPPELDAFLANPPAKVPGTKQPIRLPSEQERADVIAYLQTQQ